MMGKELSTLLNSELDGTEAALASNGRPSMKVIFPKIDAYHVGQFFMYYEMATAIAGALYNIDPYNQPGVELGKQITYSLMGRKGFESMQIKKVEKRYVIG